MNEGFSIRSPWPERYRLLHALGSGGGGQVWAALDLATGDDVALKGLNDNAREHEAEALIQEVTALSGLEGLGFPRVLGVGRGSDGRPYLVRELVRGRSFEQTVLEASLRALELLPEIADALTVVHRAGLLHGDIKPGNVIEREGGGIALVDLGLSTVLREGGVFARGLTPRYAAPEVRRGEPLTVQAEVYSLGVVLDAVLQRSTPPLLGADQKARLEEVVQRATASEPGARYPSADEFASALRRTLGLLEPPEQSRVPPWPVLGLESAAHHLKQLIVTAPSGSLVTVLGAEGSGRSTLLSRVGWGLAMSQLRVVTFDAKALVTALGDPVRQKLLSNMLGPVERDAGFALFDGEVGQLPFLRDAIARILAAGGRVVQVATERGEAAAFGVPELAFEVPELDPASIRRLLRGALPTLPQGLIPELLRRIPHHPGALRRFVQAARGRIIAGAQDLDAYVGASAPAEGAAPKSDLEAAERALDRGRYAEALDKLKRLSPEQPKAAWLHARYQNVAGSPASAAELCRKALAESEVPPELRACLTVTLGRAELGQSRWDAAMECFRELDSFPVAAQAEALSYQGLVQSFCGHQAEARSSLARAEELLPLVGPRLASIVWSCLATVEWRSGHGDESALAYTKAIAAATEANDAGTLASAQINLAGLRKVQGDLAASIELLEAAIEAATLAGRTASTQQALLNLANLDVYLGRLERARASLEKLAQLGDGNEQQRAQKLGLHADIASRQGRVQEALTLYQDCERAWSAQNRPAEAAEAVLEGLLVLLGTASDKPSEAAYVAPTQAAVDAALERGRAYLDGGDTPLLRLAEARAYWFAGDLERAEKRTVEARQLALEAGQKEWAWRALSLEAELLEKGGLYTKARRARLEATEILEEIGARLPQDLREVYWNDARRRAVREEATEYTRPRAPLVGDTSDGTSSHLSGSDIVSRLSQTPLERRLAKILAINSDLASETSFDVLSTKILLHATELLAAERGYLLLGDEPGRLEVVASRSPQGAPHREFSRSIAAEVFKSGAPFFSVDAGADQRLLRFESVHHAALSAVACVPILAPERNPIGAIYVETRARVDRNFGDEIPTLQAFADQAAIALGWLRLVRELSEKKTALEEKNARLVEAQAALKNILVERTEHLHDVKKKLEDTRAELERGTGYAGLVGASPAMRRVYALIDRVRATDVPVLITGESGTGKEVMARAIHEGSSRKKAKMLAVNCGAIPENLLESELFGHVRGAFTGADRDRRGLFQEARGGTLLLDEIGEMPLKMQAALLRVLQEGKVRPVGGAEEVAVDVRVLFATNRDLGQAVLEGRFRDDLLYRIQVVEVHLPSLRERREDIPLLIEHFLSRSLLRFPGQRRTVTRDAITKLMEFDWPGNVRQLENIITNAWVLSDGEQITADDLNLPSAGSFRPRPPGKEPSEKRPAKKGTLSEHDREERGRIVEALDKTGWNRARAAEVLGMPRRTFYRRLREYGLQ